MAQNRNKQAEHVILNIDELHNFHSVLMSTALITSLKKKRMNNSREFVYVENGGHGLAISRIATQWESLTIKVSFEYVMTCHR